ncbi:hypothetical protein ACJX0J_036274, partial [Zea mays]
RENSISSIEHRRVTKLHNLAQRKTTAFLAHMTEKGAIAIHNPIIKYYPLSLLHNLHEVHKDEHIKLHFLCLTNTRDKSKVFTQHV